eukprot:1345549-Amorphochlora_amoeboformis.AAC.2
METLAHTTSLPLIYPRFLDNTSISESESSDETVDSSFNPYTDTSDSAVQAYMLLGRSKSFCKIHSSDQCLVRCVQCLEPLCSVLNMYDIHSEVDQAWSCRSCLLSPHSVLRKPEINHSANLASPEDKDSSSDSELIQSLIEPVRSGLRTPVPSAVDTTTTATTVTTSTEKPEEVKELPSPTSCDDAKLSPSKRRTRPKRNASSLLGKKRPLLLESECSSKKSRSNDDYTTTKGGKRIKRFRCSYCPKRFDQRSNLTAHIRSHTGEKPFTCKICKRPFSQKSNMTRHMKVHRR